MNLSQAILATLAYHDIFNYPLTIVEIESLLIDKKADLPEIQKELSSLINKKRLNTQKGYYFLKNRTQILATRSIRRRYSKRKIKRAYFYASLLKFIPTIRLVGITGALAMQNSHKRDDIDLVVITSKGTLWTTRFLTSLILFPFKRDPTGHNIANRACLNLFLDETKLNIENKNAYIAHEICQMKPVWDRNKTYSQLLRQNIWVKKYLPNWRPEKDESWGAHNSYRLGATSYLSLLENPLRNFQMWYMRKKITTEKIGEGQLFFHPSDTQSWVLRAYRKRIKQLKLTDKNYGV